MKKLFFPILCTIALLCASVSYALHVFTLNGTGANRGTAVFDVDDAGNVIAAGTIAVGGNEVTVGKTIYPPTSVSVSTITSISPSASYLTLIATGTTNIILSGDLVYGPAISTTAATSGQYLILGSTNSATAVIIATGTLAGVVGSDQYIVISSTKSAVPFIFNTTVQQWVEVGRQ